MVLARKLRDELGGDCSPVLVSSVEVGVLFDSDFLLLLDWFRFPLAFGGPDEPRNDVAYFVIVIVVLLRVVLL